MLYYSVRMLESIEGHQGSVSSWVHKVRTRLGLSQYEMANLLDIHWVTVSRWENAHSEPKMSHLRKLALVYLMQALDPGKLLKEGAPTPVEVFSHAVAYDIPGIGPAVGGYVVTGLRLGYRVFYVCPRDEDWDGILSWLGVAPEVLECDAFKFLPAEEVFFRKGRFDITHMSWLLRDLAERSSEIGYPRIRWISDMRPLLAWGVARSALVSLEYITDSVFHSQKRSHGLSIYPVPGDDLLFDACLLCRHPWILSPEGPIRNPYYNDPVLCRARGYLGGEAHGDIGSHSDATIDQEVRR